MVFLFEFKMGCIAVETTCNINNTFGPEAANERISGGWRSFAKETRTLKMKSLVARHQKVTMTHWEQSSKLILFITTREAGQEFNTKHSMVVQYLKQMEEVKNLISEYFMSWLQIFLNGYFEVSSLLILCNDEPCLDWIVTATKSEFYMTTSGDQFSGWTEKKLQSTSHSQTYTPKRS